MPGKMSSDIDDEDYSSIDERDPKAKHLLSPTQQQQQQQLLPQRSRHYQQLHQQLQKPELEQQEQPAAYVNMKDANNLTLDLNNGGDAAAAAAPGSSATRRDKGRHAYSRYGRKSRSRERPRGGGVSCGNPPALSSPINPGPLNFSGPSDPERIRERERELEKIHRRSRELMLSPRGGGVTAVAAESRYGN